MTTCWARFCDQLCRKRHFDPIKLEARTVCCQPCKEDFCNAKQKCLSTVILPVCWLANFTEVVFRQVEFKLCQDNLFKNFGEKWKIRDRPKVFQIIHIKSWLLKWRFDYGWLETVRDYASCERVFMILLMTGTRTSRYCLVRGVGIGSRLQLFEALFKISFSLLASVTGSKSQNLEPVNGSQSGGSANWVSMSFLICSTLLLKNWQNVSGRSLVGMLLGSEDFSVLPSSWLVTLYSCLEEGQLQIASL